MPHFELLDQTVCSSLYTGRLKRRCEIKMEPDRTCLFECWTIFIQVFVPTKHGHSCIRLNETRPCMCLLQRSITMHVFVRRNMTGLRLSTEHDHSCGRIGETRPFCIHLDDACSFMRLSVFQCLGVSVFQCFGVSVFQSFSVSVFQCFGIPPILPQPCRT